MRQMWLIVRRAVSLAQLLDMQHKTEAEIRPERAMRQTAVWSALWPRDRVFSLILGLPYAALEPQVTPLTSNNDDSDPRRAKRLSRGFILVMGPIVCRD